MASALATNLCCVRCQTPTLVETHAQTLCCTSCDTTYPIVHGVPILFADVVIEPSNPPQLETIVTTVATYQGLPLNPANRDILSAIFSKKYRFSDFLISVESQQYLDRIASSRITATTTAPGLSPTTPPVANGLGTLKTAIKPFVPQPLRQKLRQFQTQLRRQQMQTAALPAPPTIVAAPLALKYTWTGDYLPRKMLANQCFTGNVRLQNRGDQPISSLGATPVNLAYHWRRADGERMSDIPEHRTPLPIDLAPDQSITLPMLIETPRTAGTYQLQLCLVQEHVCWHEADSQLMTIAVTTEPLPDPTAQWEHNPAIDSYYDDHIKSIDQLKSQLADLAIAHPKILEIGGNACPMLFHNFSGQLYNLDVDVHGLQIGHLMDKVIPQNPDGVTFICADANAIPFPDDYFDCITMFASLHHFPNLRTILRSLAQKIQPNGFLAMLCEPVGHHYGAEIDPVFREELLKGVNEQSFSLPEYAAIFQDAGLVPDRMIVDGYSLKAFLKKSSAT
jgi:SAM-dependent methyltransferase/uncharacterized protein YbaR (Trm112 family)